MTVHLLKSKIKTKNSIQITGSKSESNRLLLLKALYPEVKIENLSNSDDSQLMQKALSSNDELIDIHHAGTAMRFLTAYFSIQEGRNTILTGSSRMKERPISILVDALRDLGADIEYIENEGFPPLRIKGRPLPKSSTTLKANVSSQYISALLLIASKLKNGLELTLDGKITSVPYINMTLQLLKQIEIETKFADQKITVMPKISGVKSQSMVVESDWSSASYFYSIVALSDLGTEIQLSAYKEDSLQGDSVLSNIYKRFGVTTEYGENKIILRKSETISSEAEPINLDLSNAPDIAQTIAVTVYGLDLTCHLTGLHTLKIKETDRLVALKTELEKLGGTIEITDNSLKVLKSGTPAPNVAIDTYRDHRMALAFAPLALTRDISINDAYVVSKSYPDFWTDLQKLGITVK
ncbi:3-phosphoshikimate 1-carboxyvinyltransferase [Winogradskyella sp. A3E31]|uniref:3-phosphoshikimate 1-carboxyvinyltransferase n=1 Tax=Winogradskyella sp. A3E31 TaxID=3349637 RepID=UPI00398AE93B